MFTLQAPYPGLQTTTVVPNPDFGDGENLAVEVSTKRAMDGTLFTYVKRKGRRRLQWTFSLTEQRIGGTSIPSILLRFQNPGDRSQWTDMGWTLCEQPV